MDTNNKIVGIVFEIDPKIYSEGLSSGKEANDASLSATKSIMVFSDDNTKHEIVDFSNYSDSAKRTKINEYLRKARSMGISSNEVKSYYSGEAEIIDSKDRALNHKDYLSASEREKTRKGVVAKLGATATVAGLVVALAACGAHKKDVVEETVIVEETASEENGYGFYKFDLSPMEDISEYVDLIPESAQKSNALNYLNVLETFYGKLISNDTEKEIPYGLTIEQVVAIDAYANSNVYETEDYIKNFGLYNFRNVTDDFQQAISVTSAALAHKEVDGTILSDLFKDDKVRFNYLKQVSYLNDILNEENKTKRQKIVDDYCAFLNDCSIDRSSDEYLDYDQHPGMAFATSVVVNALNDNNIPLDKGVVSKLIMFGTDNAQSRINSICADAQAKLDSAMELVDDMQLYLPMNDNIRIDNEKEILLAQNEGREPILKSFMGNVELDTMIREKLCDQEQINTLINKTLEKQDKLITEEDQKLVLESAISIQRLLLDKGEGYYADAETARRAKLLLKPGDTVVETKYGVSISEEDLGGLAGAAKDSAGYIDNSDGQAEQEISQEVEETKQEGVDYYNQVLSYYETHGKSDGVPSELQDAYNNLGDELFGLAQQTGDARYMTNDENKYSGGEIEITIDENVEVENVSTDSNPQNEQFVPEVPTQNQNPEVPNNSNTETGGEITIDSGFIDAVVDNISTDPTGSTNESTIDTSTLSEPQVETQVSELQVGQPVGDEASANIENSGEVTLYSIDDLESWVNSLSDEEFDALSNAEPEKVMVK